MPALHRRLGDLCQSQQNSGYSVDGALAEYAVVAADFDTPVPEGVSSSDAAPLTCAGVTTYKAIKVAGVAPAETVAVFGIGGLGHLALQYARIAGGFVVAVDVQEDKLRMARELGADEVVNAATTDPVAAIGALGGADVFALHAAGRTKVIAVDRKLDDVNEAMADVLAGHVPARIVFQF